MMGLTKVGRQVAYIYMYIYILYRETLRRSASRRVELDGIGGCNDDNKF